MPNINKIHRGLDIKIHFVHNRLHQTEAYHGGGGVLPIMDNKQGGGGLCPKVAPFSGWRYIKGRDFTSQSIEKSRQNCHLGFKRAFQNIS